MKPQQTIPQFSGKVLPISFRIFYPVKNVPNDNHSGMLEVVRTGEEILFVNCGDKEYRFSNWYGAMQ